jgi:transposase
LYFMGRQHAGENLRNVLRYRTRGLAAPVQMSDALSRNTSGLPPGRNSWKSPLISPRPAATFWRCWAASIKYDADARQQKLSPQDRLRFHQRYSQPVIEELRGWMEAQFAQHLVESNSGLGKAITYFQRHWKGLTAFLREAGAPLDNNLCERALKRAVPHRKNCFIARCMAPKSVICS